MESPDRRRVRRPAAYAAAVGLGAGIVTGTGVASADIETDPTDPPSNSTGGRGPTVASGVVSGIAKKSPNEIPVLKGLVKASTTLARIVTNHSLVTARSV
jgi:hypothetical protein